MSEPLLSPAIAFYTDLEADNTTEFWERERHRYDRAVRPVVLELLAAIDPDVTWRVYRPHNDRRFARSAAPYKTFIGAVSERADGVGTFVQVSGRGVLVGSGIPMPAPDQLGRWREAVATASSGEAFRRAATTVSDAGVTVHGGRWEPLRRVPAGHPTDHPRAEFLRWKGVECTSRVTTPTWATAAEAAAAIRDSLHRAAPVLEWLGRHVGPSSLSAEERFAPRRR